MAPADRTGQGFAARSLLRGARVGALATSARGQPFASLITPAAAPDGSVVLLLSDLSEHTRHLTDDPRCSVLVAGVAEEVNPQTTPRLTLIGEAAPDARPALRARFLALHPYAAMYADFGDFRVWRMRPEGGLLVSGFGRAARLRESDLAPAADAVAAIEAAEPDILEHCHREHADALARIGGAPGAWRMVAVDPDGCDLAREERVIRIAWSAPVASAAEVRRELVRLAGSS